MQEDDNEKALQNRGVLWKLLDGLEDIICRMLVGVFRFIFVKLPKALFDFIEEWLPTFWKLLKVTFLIVILSCVAIGPGAYAYYFRRPYYYEGWTNWLLYAWSITAGLGAVWGLINIKLKRKGIFGIVKTIFSKDV